MLVYFSLLSLSVIWLLLLFSIPILKLTTANNIFVDNIYQVFSLICHQKSVRSYCFYGEQLPVCVRCLGLYAGLFVGLLVYPVFKNPKLVKIPDMKFIWIFLTPIIFDGISQILGLYDSPHYVRFLTGILASGGSVFYILPVLNQLYARYKTGNI